LSVKKNTTPLPITFLFLHTNSTRATIMHHCKRTSKRGQGSCVIEWGTHLLGRFLPVPPQWSASCCCVGKHSHSILSLVPPQ